MPELDTPAINLAASAVGLGDIDNFRVDFTRTTPIFKRVGSRYRAVISIFKKPMAATFPVAIYTC